MCVGYRGIFRLPPIGRLGKTPVDQQFRDHVESRALAIERACRIRPDRRDGQDEKQLSLPVVKEGLL